MPKNNRLRSGEYPSKPVPNWFGRCLKARREAQNLTKDELAILAGIAWKTVHNIETDIQPNPLPSTQLLLAKALNCTPEELHHNCLKKESWLTRNQKWLLTTTAVLTFILISVTAIALTNTNWSQTPDSVTVTDGIFNTTLWNYKPDGEIRTCTIAPWSNNVLLVALGKDAPNGGHILALNRLTGQEFWTATLNLDEIRDVFGAEIVDAAMFTAISIQPWNRAGSDSPEIAVRFTHGKWYPNAIISIDSKGTVQAQYNFYGHIRDIVVWDLDHDGRDELIVASTNNAQAYQGGMLTILNEDHFSGASVDSLAIPHSKIRDNSVARVVFPAYPAAHMKHMSDIRLSAHDIQVIEVPNEKTRISATIGHKHDERLIVFMSADLRPIRADIVDSFINTLETWPDSLTNNSGPGDERWRAEWLATHHHFSNAN